MQNKKRNIIIVSFITIILILLSCVFIINPFFNTKKLEDNKELSYSGIEYQKITGGKTVTEKIELKDNNIAGFEFYSEWRIIKDNFKFEVSLLDEENNTIYKNIFTTIGNDFPNLILLEKPIINQKGKEYTLNMKIINEDTNLYLLKNDSRNIRIDQIANRKSYWLIFFIYIAIFIGSIVLGHYIIKNRNDELSMLKKILCISAYLFTNILFAFIILYFLYRAFNTNSVPIYLNIILILLIIINAFGAIYLKKNLKKEICNLFLIIGIPIACLYLSIFTPGAGQDGIRHYARAYSLTNGELFKYNLKVDIPESVPYTRGLTLKELFTNIKNKTDYNKTYKDSNALYHPIFYVGSSLAIYLVKLCGMNAYIGWYLAKIFNMIIALTLYYIIIKKCPKKYQLLLMLYILIPINIYQFVSLSADTLINVCSLWLLTLCLTKYENKSALRLSDWVQILLTSYIILFGKSGYYLVPLAMVFLIRKNIMMDKKWWIKIISLVFLLGIMNFGWKALITTDNIMVNTNTNVINVQETGKEYALSTPYRTFTSFGNYLLTMPDQYILGFIGIGFFWDILEVPAMLAAAYLIVLIIACFNNEKIRTIDFKSIIGFIIATISVVTLVSVGMYALETHSNMATGDIWGVQGRYFIPVYILLFIILANSKNILKKDISKYLVLSSVVIHLAYIYQFILFLK